MLNLVLKPDAKTSSIPTADAKDQKQTGSISFALLLDQVDSDKKDLKSLQNGAFVLSLAKETAEQTTKDPKLPSSVISLLKGDELSDIKEELKVLELNPQLTQNKTITELKVIIKEAKQYLKNKITSLEGFKKSEIESLPKTLKITSLEGFKKSEIESLPKTLKGLVQVAKKFGIDVSKITLEEVQHHKKTFTKASSIDLDQPESKEFSKQESQTLQTERIKQPKNSTITLKETPLFQAQAKPEKITTEQIVTTKLVTSNQSVKQQKERSENTLELLLRGNQSIKNDSALTADFSVATAKVIAPSAKTPMKESLESLLGEVGEQSIDETQSVKTDGLALKSDSLDLKINEAKQMIKYLSNDVKQAIDDYKAPFTRVKVQLNPQNLGEVDLTVVQRGKNLHINLSSNNAAINTLAMNANDLKVQLNNNGIQNASLNFSSNSQGDQSGQNSHAHHQQQNHQNAHEEYGYFQLEETNEEIVSSLEIVVPHYA